MSELACGARAAAIQFWEASIVGFVCGFLPGIAISCVAFQLYMRVRMK